MIESLARVVGREHVLHTPAALIAYGVDATVGYRGTPGAAVFPGSAHEVAEVLALAADRGWTVVARGAGTSLAAGAVPPPGAVVVSLIRLREGPWVDPSALSARAGAGVTTADLQSAARAEGLFFPPDPSSQAVTTLGGNAATNAGGAHALRYGVMRHYVTGLEVALCSGDVERFERGTELEPLVDLFVGSEGTLGLITDLEVRLIPAPAARATLTASFADAAAAARATVAILAAGLTPGKLEFMDDVSIRAIQASRKRGLPSDVGALLFVELHGEVEDVQDRARAALDILRESGASNAARAETPADEARVWEARGAITSSLARLKPGKIGEDICVPRTRLAEAVTAIKRLSAERNVTIALFGHIGDGTLHPNVVYDPAEESGARAARDTLEGLARIGVELGGVLSGEHGLGLVKRDFVPLAWDWETIGAMRRLKREFDPTGILNPRIMWPEPQAPAST